LKYVEVIYWDKLEANSASCQSLLYRYTMMYSPQTLISPKDYSVFNYKTDNIQSTAFSEHLYLVLGTNS
jgi:hypothetical protein